MEESTFKKRPSSNMLLAVLTSLCCCMPLGIVAVIKASRVKLFYEKGEYALAIKASAQARRYCYVGIFLSLICWMLSLTGIIWILVYGGGFTYLMTFAKCYFLADKLL